MKLYFCDSFGLEGAWKDGWSGAVYDELVEVFVLDRLMKDLT